VTGSWQEIGKAIAARRSQDGFAVVINDIASKQAQIDAAVSEINASGAKAIGIAADVTKRAEVQSLVDKTTEQLGALQVMVANAGLVHADSIFELSKERVRQIFDVNVAGVFNYYVVAGKKMAEQGKGGKIVRASSMAAFRAGPLVSVYTASKWALRGLTQVLDC
jgi:meso-butanediol dehydrogenase / (S,S)-butanediol dehydrogenase / diacetyl reductase